MVVGQNSVEVRPTNISKATTFEAIYQQIATGSMAGLFGSEGDRGPPGSHTPNKASMALSAAAREAREAAMRDYQSVSDTERDSDTTSFAAAAALLRNRSTESGLLRAESRSGSEAGDMELSNSTTNFEVLLGLGAATSLSKQESSSGTSASTGGAPLGFLEQGEKSSSAKGAAAGVPPPGGGGNGAAGGPNVFSTTNGTSAGTSSTSQTGARTRPLPNILSTQSVRKRHDFVFVAGDFVKRDEDIFAAVRKITDYSADDFSPKVVAEYGAATAVTTSGTSASESGHSRPDSFGDLLGGPAPYNFYCATVGKKSSRAMYHMTDSNDVQFLMARLAWHLRKDNAQPGDKSGDLGD